MTVKMTASITLLLALLLALAPLRAWTMVDADCMGNDRAAHECCQEPASEECEECDQSLPALPDLDLPVPVHAFEEMVPTPSVFRLTAGHEPPLQPPI